MTTSPSLVSSGRMRRSQRRGASDGPGGAPDELAELRHEVGNALTSASGYAQLLARRMPAWATEADRQVVVAIREAIERAHRLLAPDRAPPVGQDLGLLIDDALSQVPPERGADVSLRWLATGPLTGAWDGAQVVQVLANLLQNAVKYSPEGSPIEVEIARAGAGARVTVRDRGIGVHPDDLDAVFAGYRTIAARRTAPGQGIGLRLSRRLAERAGGRLWATSTPGVGSTFVLDLPLGAASRR
jgi:signal transduction histidine kinase